MITCTKRLEFDAAHRLLNHTGPCRYLHGHRYCAEITVQATKLDDLGMVLDFSVIKEKVGKWVLDNWDHNILLHKDDPLLAIHEDLESSFGGRGSRYRQLLFGDKPPFIMSDRNPTAENMAEMLFIQSQILLPNHLKVTHVRLYETPSSFADFHAD